MNTKINWRSAVRFALFVAGFMLMAMAFGEDDRELREWLAVHLGLFIAGAAAFRALAFCDKKWTSTAPDRDRHGN